MSTTLDESAPMETRPCLPVTRTHQRFLLRQLHFTQQFAALYYHRLTTLQPRAIERFQTTSAYYSPEPGVGADYRRALELETGALSLCVGTLFKHMKAYSRFLDEYQKELVRIELGEEDGEEGGEGGGEEGDGLDDGAGGVADLDIDNGTAAAVIATTGDNYCTPADVLLLEDDSGRLELTGANPDLFVTGMIVYVVGVLLEKGKFDVKEIVLCGPAPQIPRGLPPSNSGAQPVYIAFTSGFLVGYNGAGAASLDLLVDFLSGNLGDDRMVQLASRISRLVIGGNCIDQCDEQRLKYKVKLDPSDHVRVTDMSCANTAANAMRELDAVLAALADTVDVDVMPGEFDPSNSFLPQQPIHPILLREASKRSTLRLVTNPYEFTAFPFGKPPLRGKTVDVLDDEEGEVTTTTTNKEDTYLGGGTFFVTSGCNVDDMAKQSRWDSPLDALAACAECGCACPTAPNTMVCYPFQDCDPFMFPETPHVLIACNQSAFATEMRVIPQKQGSVARCRLINVPSFAKTGGLVLVDVTSPDLNTTVLELN